VTDSRTIVIGVDQGTTNTKVVAVDPDGRVVHRATRPIATQAPRDGWVEQDAEEMFANVVGCVREVLAASGRSARDVAGLGIANQTETLVVWERATGRPVMPAIVWQCRRGEAELRDLREDGVAAMVRGRTGLDLDPTFTAAKLRWLFANRPAIADGLRRGDHLFGTVDCWLLWKLTEGSSYATDSSNASRTMLFDIARAAWDAELFALFGLTMASLPEVRHSAGAFGHTSPALFGGPIAITGMLGDQQASLFGHGCFMAGQIKATFGTGAFIWLNAGERPDFTVADGLIRTIAWHLDRPCYAVEGFVMYAGATLDWLATRLSIPEGGAGVVERARQAASSGGATLVPAFQGLAAPWWRPEARAALLGLSQSTSAGQLCHAGLEAICFQVRAIIELIAGSGGGSIDLLRVDGGPTRSPYLMQLQADVLQRPLAVSGVDSLTSYGAALMAGLGAGLWTDLDALRQVVGTAAVVHPDAARAAAWDSAYRHWRATTEAVLGLSGNRGGGA
jgi:glycerol kinase